MKRKRQINPRFERTLGTTKEGGDAIERLMFIESRYNRYGYFLIVGGIMSLVTLMLGIRAGAMNWYQSFVTTTFILFAHLVGFKLIRKAPEQRTIRNERRPSELDD